MKTETRRPKHETNFLGSVIVNVRTSYATGVRDTSNNAFAYVAHGETKFENPYIVFSIAPDNTMVEGVPLDHLIKAHSTKIELQRHAWRGGALATAAESGLFIGHWTGRGVTREVRLSLGEIEKVLVFWDQWALKR